MSHQGLALNNRRWKIAIGWGNNAVALPPALALAVHPGATRNVYVGNIEDFDTFTEKPKRDFGEYGEIELVNFSKKYVSTPIFRHHLHAPSSTCAGERLLITNLCAFRNCAFVNFINIASAIKATDSVKNKTDYLNLRIAHGKDRRANPPRLGQQDGLCSRRGGSSSQPPSAIEPVKDVVNMLAQNAPP